MQKPNISSAIPRQRYRLGAYTVVVLGEIESPDETEYECMLAAIEDGHYEPEVYITCEKAAGDPGRGLYTVRVFAAQLGNQELGLIIGQSREWGSQEAFVSYALSGFQQMLQLQDEKPVPVK